MIGVALAATIVIAVGASTARYMSVIKEMNLLFNGQVMVVSKDAIVVQAIPITGSMLPQDSTIQKIGEAEGAGRIVPILFVTNVETSGIQPVNFSFGIPVGDWNLILGPISLRRGEGRLPLSESSTEVVIGLSLAGQYGWTVGSNLNINGYNMTVTGVLETSLAILTRSFIMPLGMAQEVYNYPKSVNIITIKPIEGFSEENLTEAIESNVKNMNNVTYVNALTERERNDVILPVLAQVETWNFGLQTAIFTMCIILVMTVMLISVSERRRDFATLDAIGAPLSYVFKVVIFETALIGVLGGVLGVFFGSLGALVLASLYTSIPFTQFFPSVFEIIPPFYMLQMFAAVIAVCCLGGIIPALNAARMRVAETLRSEY
jgi:ABC-type lipoprotein release transport system permease subunit